MVYPSLNPCPDWVVGKTDLVLIAVQGAPSLSGCQGKPDEDNHVTLRDTARRGEGSWCHRDNSIEFRRKILRVTPVHN